MFVNLLLSIVGLAWAYREIRCFFLFMFSFELAIWGGNAVYHRFQTSLLRKIWIWNLENLAWQFKDVLEIPVVSWFLRLIKNLCPKWMVQPEVRHLVDDQKSWCPNNAMVVLMAKLWWSNRSNLGCLQELRFPTLLKPLKKKLWQLWNV